MLFAYFGPDTVMPLTSILAAAVGFVLMFGRQAGRLAALAVTGAARRCGLRGRGAEPGSAAPARWGRRSDRPTAVRARRPTTRPDRVRS